MLDVNTGEVVGSYYYDAFGNILEQSGDVDNSILYSGYQFDEETGLYYLNARMYDPKIARFLQEDSYRGNINDPLSLNLYTYCHNQPIKYDDPTGHAINVAAGAIGAVGGFIFGVGAAVISDAFNGGASFDNWQTYLGAGSQGAIVGGVGGLTFGLGLGAVASYGLAAGAVGNVANQTIRNGGFDNFNTDELLISSVAGGAGVLGANFASSSVPILTNSISSGLTKTVITGAVIGFGGGAGSGFAGNVTQQGLDIYRDDARSIGDFSFTELAKQTTTEALLGGIIGGGFGYAGGKYQQIKTNRLNGANGSKAYKSIDNRLRQNELFENGERIATTKEIRKYKKQMKKQGIDVVFDKKGNVLQGNKAAGFDYSSGKIYIKKKSGVIDLGKFKKITGQFQIKIYSETNNFGKQKINSRFLV